MYVLYYILYIYIYMYSVYVFKYKLMNIYIYIILCNVYFSYLSRLHMCAYPIRSLFMDLREVFF